MAYDRADWHYGGDYPADLPPENGATHIGFFLAWIINHDMVGSFHIDESVDALRKLRLREISGREFLITECDEKLWEEDLNEEGNSFTKAYYDVGAYMDDYEEVLGDYYPTVYHVPDTWENYEKIAGRIDQRFKEWKLRSRKPWWKFWM